ncbi:hypothetical protein ACTACK_10295 [Pseudomonas syringae]|uniref:hypothetical protein n=1 Tax=Pseudomonas syringae TaxID=317 RepID=UPI003F756B3F
MTNNKPNDVRVVPRELLERISQTCMFTLASSDYEQLRAILAQPADQQGEPVGQWSDDDGISWCDGNESSLASARASGWLTRTLYRHAQPATAKVVLPERKREATEDSDIMLDCQSEGWNACLDEVAKLNTPQ